MLFWILSAAVASANIPAATTTEMSFARLLATRLAMEFAHTPPDGHQRLEVRRLNGRLFVHVEGRVLPIGKQQTALSRRLRALTRNLARPVRLVVYPPGGGADLERWIERTTERWEERDEALKQSSGIAPADLLEQRALNNWDQMTIKEIKRLTPITYAEVLFGEVELPKPYRARVEREFEVLGLSPDPSARDVATLNRFLKRANCGREL